MLRLLSVPSNRGETSSWLAIFDKKFSEIETLLYKKTLSLTREIHELSGLILDMNEMSIEVNLKEFEGLL